MEKSNFIRHFATVLLGCALCFSAYSQHTTEFLFSPAKNVPDNIRKIMQSNATTVFAEINRAHNQNKSLRLSLANVTDKANNRITNMWAMSPFYCPEVYLATKVSKTKEGYEVRGIPVFIENDDDHDQEIVIEFTFNGKIDDITKPLPLHQVEKIKGNSNEVIDLRRREIIVKLVEHFKNAYNTKDMKFLNDIYSDDALIITGTVSTLTPQKRSDAPMVYNKPQIEYKTLTKEEYLAKLSEIFKNNTYINIKFADVAVTQDINKPYIYGVTLKQSWTTKPFKDSPKGGYHDDGWLFLVIDYKDENAPVIWVRTWQPMQDKAGNIIHYNVGDIYSLEDIGF